jgi:hypothetical protein
MDSGSRSSSVRPDMRLQMCWWIQERLARRERLSSFTAQHVAGGFMLIASPRRMASLLSETATGRLT